MTRYHCWGDGVGGGGGETGHIDWVGEAGGGKALCPNRRRDMGRCSENRAGEILLGAEELCPDRGDMGRHGEMWSSNRRGGIGWSVGASIWLGGGEAWHCCLGMGGGMAWWSGAEGLVGVQGWSSVPGSIGCWREVGVTPGSDPIPRSASDTLPSRAACW